MPLARQSLHDQQEEIHAAVWPEAREMYQVASRHYAFEGRCYVVVAGSILRLEDLPSELPVAPAVAREYASQPLLRGGSAIIAPDGSYLAGPVYDEETIVMADLDLDMIGRESLALDVSGHYSRPDVFEMKVHAGRRSVPPEATVPTAAKGRPSKRARRIGP